MKYRSYRGAESLYNGTLEHTGHHGKARYIAKLERKYARFVDICNRINTNFEGWTVIFEFLDNILYVGPPGRWGRCLGAPLRLVRAVNLLLLHSNDKQSRP
jgi:hypothetical protein